MIGTGSFNVKGIEITPEKDQFNNNGRRIVDRSKQSYTIVSFYQRKGPQSFNDNVFFSVNYQDFFYCKLQYWIGREGYQHPNHEPSYVYYFEEECIWNNIWNDDFWSENKIIFASGWDQYIRTNTDNGTSDVDAYPPLNLNDVQDPDRSRPTYLELDENIVFRKPLKADEDNETHIRGIAYLL